MPRMRVISDASGNVVRIPDIPPVVKFADFIGQEKLIADLQNRVEFAKSSSKPLPHIMLSASPEMGKVTLAKAIAAELGVNAFLLSPAKMRSDPGLVGMLTRVTDGDLLLVDDVSGMKKTVSDRFYHAIATGRCEVTIGAGSSERTITMPLKQFTVVLTTSKPWQIAATLRRWFVVYDFVPYSPENIRDILIRLARNQGFEIDSEAGDRLAGFCFGSPGNAAVLAKRIHHFIRDISSDLKINAQHIPKILGHLGYEENYPQSLSIADKFAQMSGLDFEKWVAEHFRSLGYRVEMTGTTGDHGVDLLLYKNNALCAAVQCKRWDGSIGEPVTRDFYGALVSSKAPEGYIFATTSFTQQAIDFVQGKPIQLIDLESLMKL